MRCWDSDGNTGACDLRLARTTAALSSPGTKNALAICCLKFDYHKRRTAFKCGIVMASFR
jgi:hypothetical protein